MSNDKDMDNNIDALPDEEMLESDMGEEEFAADEFGEEGEWDEYEEEFGDFEEAEPARKKLPLSFNMIVIIGAVVVGLAVLYFTVIGGGGDAVDNNALPPQPAPAQMAALPPEQPAPDAQSQPQPLQPTMPPAAGGMFDDVASLDGVGGARPGGESNDGYEDSADSQMLQPSGEEDYQDGPLMPLPAKDPSDSLTAGLPSAQDVMITSSNTDPATANLSRPAISEDQTSSLIERFESLERQLEKLQDSVASKGELADLSKKIAALEKRVEQGRTQGGSGQQAAAKKITSAPAQAPARMADISDWVLKSARPGAAILGKKGSEEVIAVSEGDSLQAIGKIVSIQPEDGLWTVQGTKGRITQ